MNRLTGDIVLEIRTFLDPESFYRWILASHVVSGELFDSSLDVIEDTSSLMRSGRPMIQKWLSKYVDFPIVKIHFGRTRQYRRILKAGGLSTNPDWMMERNAEKSTRAPNTKLAYTDGSNYFLDFMSDHLDVQWEEENRSSNKQANWFEEVIPNSHCEIWKRDAWFESPNKTCYSYWPILQFVTDRILTDAIIRNRHYMENGHFRFCLSQYFFLVALERQGCLEFPPHDRMFAIPSVLDRTCLVPGYETDRRTSYTAKSTTDRNLANSFTVLDLIGGYFDDIQNRNYYGTKIPHWELVRGDNNNRQDKEEEEKKVEEYDGEEDEDDNKDDGASGRLLLRWSFREAARGFRSDRKSEPNQENNIDIQHGYIPWCGSSETSEETEASWALLRKVICQWIDKRLTDFDPEIDEELTQEIVENLIYSKDLVDGTIEMDDHDDHDGEALMVYLEKQDSDAEMWVENKALRPGILKQRIQRIKRLAKDGLNQWKKYFEGPVDVYGQSENGGDLLSHQIGNHMDFATWQSIGLSDRRRLRFDPAKFNDWMSNAIENSDFTASPSSTSLLQFAAEDLGLGLSWRVEGANGEVAAMLLGPHGSIWVKQQDRTAFEYFCASDDDESYCSESSCSQDDPNSQPIKERLDYIIQDERIEESTEEPLAKRQKIRTSVTPDRIVSSSNLQQKLLEKMEAMEMEVAKLNAANADLKAANTNLKADLKEHVGVMYSNLKAEMKSTGSEIEDIKATLRVCLGAGRSSAL